MESSGANKFITGGGFGGGFGSSKVSSAVQNSVFKDLAKKWTS